MLVYTVQDREYNGLGYIASLSSLMAAEDLVKILIEQDEVDGCADESRYLIKERLICFADAAETCGNCRNGVCMADEPAVVCPARRKK